MEEAEKLRSIGREYLSVAGQRFLEIYLQDCKFDRARVYLLGYIDGLWEIGKISNEDASEVYKKIGVHPIRAAEIRDVSQRK